HCRVDGVYTATLLMNGTVLLVESADDPTPAQHVDLAEVYDPATGTFADIGYLGVTHEFSAAVRLADGTVLITGGQFLGGNGSAGSELYVPATGSFASAGNMTLGRHSHTATLLRDGTVLITGGFSTWPRATASAEIYGIAAPAAALVSAASYDGLRLANESIAALFGSDLATSTLSAPTLPLPTQLGGTSVKLRDSANVERLAPLFFISPTQVNLQIPPGTASGLARVSVTNSNGKTSTTTAMIEMIAPGLFSADSSGQGLAAASVPRVRADGSQVFEPVARYDPAQNKFVAAPIDFGPETDQLFLVLFGTGIRNRSSLFSVRASIGGTEMEVL